MKVLLIEDERDIAELVEYNLKQEKITCQICLRGSEGISAAKKEPPDLVVLDLMLPDVNGLDVARNLKADPKTKHVPILILTAKSEEVDRIVGFEVGADDYMTKPFSTRELVLRIKAILRRTKEKSASQVNIGITTFGNLSIDPEKFQVHVSKKEVKLTAIEFKLLSFLMAGKGRVATRDKLLDQVWGYDSALTTRTVDTHVKRLRQKLGPKADYIETLRGVGYRFLETPP